MFFNYRRTLRRQIYVIYKNKNLWVQQKMVRIDGDIRLASIIKLFQINSYWADKHNFNGLFGWLGIKG